MTLSYDLLQLSFQNSSIIENIKESLKSAAEKGCISTEVYGIESEDLDIIVSYLKDQGFKLWDYNKFAKILFISWL